MSEPVSAPQSDASKQRVESYDGMRGVAILFVVFAHCSGYGWEFRHIPGQEWQFWYGLLVRNLGMVSLPLFLFISGYWLAKAPCQTFSDYKTFLQRRVSRVFVPYVFWSVFFIALFAVASGQFDPVDAAWKLLLGQALGPFYFIQVMIQLYLLTPLYVWWTRRKNGLLEILVIHLAFLALLYVIRIGWVPNMAYVYVKLPFLCWAFWYAFGIAARTRPHLIEGFRVPVLLAVTAVLFVLNNLESGAFLWLERLRGTNHEELIISDVRFFAEAYALAFLLLFMQMRSWNWPGWLVWYGKVAFGIFFIHGLFLLVFMKVGEMAPSLFAIQPVFQTIAAVSIVAICTVIIWVSHRVFPKFINERIFGF